MLRPSFLRLLFWLLCTVVAVLALVPTEVLPPSVFDWSDKAQHALGFAGLGLLGLQAYPQHRLGLFVGLLAFGGAIELAQAATTWRQGEWADWLADGVGLGVVWGVTHPNAGWQRSRSTRAGVDRPNVR